MKDTEALAVMQGIYKAVGAAVSTKDADSLRSQVDAELIDMYEAVGVERIELRVGDESVGTLSLRKSTKAKTKTTVYVNDAVAAAKFVAADEALAQREVSTETEPKGTVLGTTIRGCEPADVAKALGNDLPDTIAGLLGA